MEAWRIELYRRELYHHGILGQKWGDRNGPPYPLNSSDHSVAERKAGWRKSLREEKKVEKWRKKNLSRIDANYGMHTNELKYQNERLDKKLKKQPGSEKLLLKKEYNQHLIKQLQDSKRKEKHFVQNATMQDIKAEQVKVGKLYAQSFLKDTLASAILPKKYASPYIYWSNLFYKDAARSRARGTYVDVPMNTIARKRAEAAYAKNRNA